MTKAIVLKAIQSTPGIWHVGFDGCLLGDSPAYKDKAAAQQAIIKIMDADEARNPNEQYKTYIRAR